MLIPLVSTSNRQEKRKKSELYYLNKTSLSYFIDFCLHTSLLSKWCRQGRTFACFSFNFKNDSTSPQTLKHNLVEMFEKLLH